MREEKAFLLLLIDNTGQLIPKKIILAKKRKKALRAIEYLPDYSVDGNKAFFSGIACSCKCELREIPLIRAEDS